ncbi:hypothetical protein Esti_002354 [Eimeria stiedai]
MSRKLYRWVGFANFQLHASRVMHRPWRFDVLLFGGFLLLFCTAAATLARQPGVNEDTAGIGAQLLEKAAYKAAGVIGVRRPSAPLDGKPSTGPEKSDTSREKAFPGQKGSELLVHFRQLSRDSLKQRWVELRVEVLGPDGKTNSAYNGSVTASLIVAGVEDWDDSGTFDDQGDGDLYTEKAVELKSNFAIQGIAVLFFSPPIDGTYRFSVTCGGCKNRVMTEKHKLAAGAQAILKVVSQPSGGTSGTVLRQQPAVQIVNRNGGALHQKANIVATLIPASDESHESAAPMSWTFETDERGYAAAQNISISRTGRHVMRFVTTLWEDTRLEVSSAPFEIIAGPAVSAVFSLKPPSRLLLREPFSVVITILDAHGNETSNTPELQKEGEAVQVRIEAFDEPGHSVQLNGLTSRVWLGSELPFEGLWLSQPALATCSLCTKPVADSSALVQAISTARVHVDPIPLLVERLNISGSKDAPPPVDNWGRIRVSLKVDEWRFEAPQNPVVIEVGAVTVINPRQGLKPEDGAKYLKVQPARLVFSPEKAIEAQEINVQPWSPGVLVGSEEFSQGPSEVFIGAFSVELRVVSEDPVWSSSAVSFEFAPPSFRHGVTSIMPQENAKSVLVYAKDSDTRELLLSFPNSQLVREGEKIEYRMRLSSKPLANEKVEVTISASISCAVQPEFLLFTEENWDVEQTVVLFVEQDDIAAPQNSSEKGVVTGNSIRAVILQHSVSSSRADNEWIVRDGHELAFSVWDDDIPGVTWLSNLGTIVDSPNFSLAFTLSSQPVHPVSLTLTCEGTEVTSHQSEHGQAKGSWGDKGTASQEAGTVVINPQDWRKEHRFLLQLTDMISSSVRSFSSSHGTSLVSLIVRGNLAFMGGKLVSFRSDFKSQDERLVTAGQEFLVPLLVNHDRRGARIMSFRSNNEANVPVAACLKGQYLWTDNRIVECAPCPPGFECPFPNESPRPCGSGHMSLGGLIACVPCLEGFLCPEGTAVPSQLKPGFYRHLQRDGESLEKGSTFALKCPEGFYCLGGSTLPRPCLPGYVSGEGAHECTPCPAGAACKSSRASDVEPCRSGTYSFKGQRICQLCPAGFACANSQNISSFRSNLSSEVDGAAVNSEDTKGVVEIASTAGIVHAELLLPCALGKYSDEGETDCSACGGTFACPTPSTKTYCFTPYTVALPDNPTECVPCPAGHSCRNGIVEKCPDFHYARLGDGFCRLCKGGYLCKGGAEAPDEGDLVPIGYYRSDIDATLHRCPNGTLGSIPGATTEETCSSCPAGYMCEISDADGEYPRAVAEPCPAGHVCILTNQIKAQLLLNAGHALLEHTAQQQLLQRLAFLVRTASIAHVAWEPCLADTLRIPSMEHAVAGPLTTISDCGMKAGVFMALEDGQPTGAATCPPGTTHPDNMGSGNSGWYSMEACPAGYYCPRGSAKAIPCPPGTEGSNAKSTNGNIFNSDRCGGLNVYSYARRYVVVVWNGDAQLMRLWQLLPYWQHGAHPMPKKNVFDQSQWSPICLQLRACASSPYESCVSCSSSKICPEGSSTEYSCPKGWYYDEANDGQCQICSIGYYCSTGVPVACRAGTYGAYVPEKESPDCLPCPEGFFCDEAAMTRVSIKPCTAGYTCNSTGLPRPRTICPAGAYCPEGTAISAGTPCPAGTWSSQTGLTSISECKRVRAGVYSYEGATSVDGHGRCAKGYYCPEGSADPFAASCPPGTYNPEEGGVSVDDCLPCPEGKDCSEFAVSEPRECPTSHFCPPNSTRPVACPTGTYSKESGLKSESQCIKCPAGKFCSRAGLAVPAGSCEPGFLCYGGARVSKPTDGITGEICPPGGYCLAGAERVTPCPHGYYNPRAGATSPSACIICPLGDYCDGAAVTTGGIAGPCQEGFYCLEGSSSATSFPTPQGYFAPPGSSSPLACYPGTYQDDTRSASCVPCPAGRYCQTLAMTTATSCPESSYCPAGSVAPQLCPVGTYSTASNLQYDSECKPCPAGKYCGDHGLKAPSGDCQAGFYCGGGSGSSAPQERSGPNQVCPEGFYCPAGISSPQPCPANTYSPSRQAISIGACLPCDPGMVCSSQGIAAPDGVCPAGSYCPKGKSATLCPKGHECPPGSAAPTPCKHGTFSDAQGALQCRECPKGFYCENASVEPGEGQKCPSGFFCPPGTAFPQEYPCPQGTLREEPGATSLDDCVPCPEGKYCTGPGASVETGDIAGGYYSSSGATSSKPLQGCMILAAVVGAQTTPCEGFEHPLASFAEAESRCLSVDECKGIVETPEGTFFLRCGNYSKEGEHSQKIFHPKHCVVGGICEPGTYCPSGSTTPQQCPAGQYCSDFALSNPSGDCDTGFFCPMGSTSPHPYSALCPPGHYCNDTEDSPVPCPLGKVLSGRGGSSVADCVSCPPGYYCDTPGLSAPTGPCPAGTFCERETLNADDATSCEPGYMCPKGSPAPTPCPPGTKQPLAGQITCELCSAGEACSGGAKNGEPCPPGFICPEGLAVKTSFPCPPGTYAPISLLADTACTSCLPGFYCESAGSTEPTAPCTGGYYCLEGTEWREPTTFCKHGEYCPPGSKAPLDCPPNHFCNTVKLMEPSGPCDAGFICTSRSTTPRPTGQEAGAACEESMNGRPCRKGHYCPAPASPLIAGSGFGGTGGEGLPATQSYLMLPSNAVMDPDTRDIYIADFKNFAIKRVSGSTGLIKTILSGSSAVGSLSWIRNNGPVGLAFCSKTRTLFISYPGPNAVVEYNVLSGFFSVINSVSSVASKPLGLVLDSGCSHLYVADSANHRVLKYTLEGANVETIAGTGTRRLPSMGANANKQPLPNQLNSPSGVAINDNMLYIADTGNKRVVEVDISAPQGFRVVAGEGADVEGAGPLSVDKQKASEKSLEMPVSLAIADDQVSPARLRLLNLQTLKLGTLADYSAWVSGLIEAAKRKVAQTGLEAAFNGISPFYKVRTIRTGVLFADTYMQRIRRIDLHEDLFSAPAVVDVPCPAGTYLPYTGAASKAECKPCPYGMYCMEEGLSEPQGPCDVGYYCPPGSTKPTAEKCSPGHYCIAHTEPIRYIVTRSSFGRLSELSDVTTDLEIASEAAKATSGWFRNAAKTACPAKVGFQQPSSLVEKEDEEIFAMELEKPMDLTKIQIDSKLAQPPDLIAAEIRTRDSRFIIFEASSQVRTPRRRTSISKRRIPFRFARNNVYVNSNPGQLVGVQALRLRFAPGASSTVRSVVLHTRDTRGPVAQKKCPPGTFQPEEGAAQCVTCPAGHYCDAFGLVEAKKCPAGFYCPAGSFQAAPAYCKLGWISADSGASSDVGCVPCTAGYFCAARGGTQPTGRCAAGYYCTGGSWTPTPAAEMLHPDTGEILNVGDICPPKTFCAEGASEPEACPAGTFSEELGLVSRDACTVCAPGFGCVSAGVQLPCAAGYFCLEGSDTTTPSDETKGGPCPAGSFCPEGSFAPKARLCPAGTFSLKGQAFCTSCSAGKYCYEPGRKQDGEPCPEGHYCPEQTVAPKPCGPGTLQDEPGQQQCKACPKGYYCSSYRASQTSGKCYAGNMCVSGATHPRFTDVVYDFETKKNGLCPTGHYCVEGALEPSPCPEGHYQDKPGAGACIECPKGKYCSGEGNKRPTGDCAAGYVCTGGASSSTPSPKTGSVCPAGWFCLEGATHPAPCAPGTYTAEPGQDSCTLCPAGFYCDKPGEGPKRCLRGRICPEGSAQPDLCPLGSFVDDDAEDEADSCRPCPYGKYCRGGVVAGDCLPGFLCGLGNWVPNPWSDKVLNEPYVPRSEAGSVTLLSAENWSTVGKTAYGGIPCPPGHYCPAGTTEPEPCPSGSVRQDNLGRWESDCSICPSGFYCPSLSLTPKACPIGHFCPLGSTEPTPCFAGTFNPHEEGGDTSACLVCIRGYICAVEGLGDLDSDHQCSAGHYCLEGSQSPIPCPPGTYTEERGGTSESECSLCPAGAYCPEEGSAKPGPTCPEGHVCPAGTAVPRKCLQGTWCPAGSGVAQQCPPGAVCPPGSVAPKPCPLGSYCPSDVSEPIKCPAGYMGSQDRSDTTTLESGCTICPKGTFTSKAGMTECSPCTPGYVCHEGCNSAFPTDKERDNGFRCAPGTYCPKGSTEEILCPAGTYGLQAAASSVDGCFPCSPGTYNPDEGQTGCLLCGATATSHSRATTCYCKGTNRSFQAADSACVCLAGFQYMQGGLDFSNQDGTEPCQQTIYEECGLGESRDATGACTSIDSTCSTECGPAGGSFSTVSGLCSCFGESPLSEICDENCRAVRPQLLLKDLKLVIEDPNSTSGDVEYSLEELTTQRGLVAGSFDCPEKAGCPVKMFDTTLAKMTGLLGVPQSFVDDINERLQEELSESRNDLSELLQARRLGDDADFGYFGVSDPVLCLPLGSTVAWHVRPSPNPIYPIYLRSNLLNTNQHFDYGAFRDLDSNLQAGEQLILFVFTFKEPGLYVFGLNSDPNKMLLLRIMEANKLCRAAALLPQLRTSEALAAISARLPTTVETSDWSIFVIVLLTVLVVVGLLFIATWTLTRQNLERLESGFTGCSAKTFKEPAMRTDAMTDLVLQKQPAMAVKEDIAVVRARRALVRRLKAQDPRLFTAVLKMSKEIQQEVEEQCDLIGKERMEGLMNLLEKAKHLNEEFTSNLQDITNSEAWLKKHDEEREEALSSLRSLLDLKRKDLVNKLARAAKDKEEVCTAMEFHVSKSKDGWPFAIDDTDGLWSEERGASSNILLPAVGESGQTQLATKKLSAEQQMEGLIEEFRKAREDAEDNLAEVMEIYKAKLRSLLQTVTSHVLGHAPNSMSIRTLNRGTCTACEFQLMKSSALLELDAARARLEQCEDEAEESRAVAIYRIMSNAARGLKTYEATVMRETFSCIQTAHKALSDARAAINAEQLSAEVAATALKNAIILTAEKAKAKINGAASEVADAFSTAESEAAVQTSSWAEEFGARLRDLHDDVIMCQNKALTFVFASESRVLLSCIQDTKSLILDQIRSRYEKTLACRRAECLDEMNVLMKASVSEAARRNQQKLSDELVERIQSDVQHQRDLDLEWATAVLGKTATARVDCLKNRQNAFKSRKLLMLRRRQELAIKQVQPQARVTHALLCRGLRILLQQQKVRKALGFKFMICSRHMQELIRTKPEDASVAAALLEELRLHQAASFATHHEQLQAALKGERQAAIDEAWDMESGARKNIQAELEDLSEELAQAKTRLAEATRNEESSRESYATALFGITQQQERGLKELQIGHELGVFKQTLLSGTGGLLMTRAAEIRDGGIGDAEGDEWFHKEWKVAQAEFEPFLIRERERYRQLVDTACKEQEANELQVLMEGRERQQHQAALMKSLEFFEEQGEDELCRKRAEFGISEIHRIIWRFCTAPPFRESNEESLHGRPEALSDDFEGQEEEAVNELKRRLRCRRKRQFEYCVAHRRLLRARSRGVLKALQEETLQWTSATGESFQSLSRVSAMIGAAEACTDTLALVEQAHRRFEEALSQLQREHEEAEERERLRLDEEKISRLKAHEETKQKINAEHEARVALADDDTKERLLQEHEHMLALMESTLIAEQQEQDARAQKRLLERKETLRRKRQQAEYEKEKEVREAKLKLEAQLEAERREREIASKRAELQRLVSQATSATAMLELARRLHNQEVSDLLLKLSLQKAEHMNTFTEAFWKQKGGRCASHCCAAAAGEMSRWLRMLQVEYSVHFYPSTRAWPAFQMDDQNTLQRQTLENQQAEELENLLKRMEQRARMRQDGEVLQLSEEEQYAQLRKEAETAAEKQVVLLEERMLGQQQQFIKEMEEKRQVYDKWLSRMRHRKEAEEHRKALQATHAQLQQQGRQWQKDGLKNLLAQYDTDRQQLEAALVAEAERQHKCSQRRKMLRNAERGERLQQKRFIEKERFLAYQSEIRRREAALSHARDSLRAQRNLVEMLNQQELKRRQAIYILARKLEEEHHWMPIWRQVIEEEQQAGTFDTWDLEDAQIPFAGSFASSLLHSERMLQLKAPHVRKIIEGIQKISKLVALVKSAAASEAAVSEDNMTSKITLTSDASSSPSSSEDSSVSGTQSGTEDSSSSSSSDSPALSDSSSQGKRSCGSDASSVGSNASDSKVSDSQSSEDSDTSGSDSDGSDSEGRDKLHDLT